MTAACFPGGKESLGGLTHSDKKRRGTYETDVDRENLQASSLAITPKDIQPWTSRTPKLPESTQVQAGGPRGCTVSQGQPELAGHLTEL